MKNCLIIEVQQKNSADERHWAELARNWDELSPAERNTYVEQEIFGTFNFTSRYTDYSIYAGQDGKMLSFFYPWGEIEYTVAELQAKGMLYEQWEARGYSSYEEMVICEEWDDDDEEDVDEGACQ